MHKLFRFNILGIDISDFSIEAVCLKRGLGRPRVSAYSRIELEPGIANDGRIVNPELLAANLEKLLKTAKPQPIKDRLCLVSLPESQVFTHLFRLPATLDLNQVRKSILYEVESILPITLAESYYDYQIVKKDKLYQQVFYAATYKSLVHNYIEVFRRVGLIPVAFDLESASLSRALIKKGLIVEKPGSELIVDIGARTTNVAVIYENKVAGTLTIPIAGQHFTDAVAKQMNFPPIEAEKVKKDSGFDPNKSQGQILKILSQEFNPIISEIKRYIIYLAEHHEIRIDKIILAGGSVLLPQLKNYFQSHFSQKVEINNPLSRVSVSNSRLPHTDYLLYANAIGLALRGLARDPYHSGLNFLSQAKERVKSRHLEEFLAKPKVDKKLIALIAFFSIGILFLAGLIWYKYFYSVGKFDDLNSVSASSPEINLEKIINFSDEDIGSDEIAGRLLSTDIEIKKNFTATGKEEKILPLEGVITVVNDSNRDQTLVADTRLVTDKNDLFRLKKSVIISAHSREEAGIYSLSAERQEVKGRLTIPGLSSSLQKLIYGQAMTPLTNQIESQTQVTDDDIAQATQSLLAEAEAKAIKTFETKILTDELLIPQVINREDIKVNISRLVSKPAGNFEGELLAKMSGIAVKKEDIINEIRTNFTEAIEINLTDYSIDIKKTDWANNRIYVIIKSVVEK